MENNNYFYRNHFYDIFEYLLALFIIIDCRVIWGYLSNTPTWWGDFKFLMTTFSLIGCLVTYRSIKTSNFIRGTLSVVMTAIYLFVYLAFNPYHLKSVLELIIIILLMILFVNCICSSQNIPTILVKYKQLIVLIAMVSLFFWIFGSLLGTISPKSISLTSWTGTDFYSPVSNYWNIYFETQKSNLSGILPITFIRNSALFTEAPMASLNFIIALAIDLLVEKNDLSWKSYILIFAIISTISVTGYLLLMGIFIARFIIQKSDSMVSRIIRILIFPILIVILIFAMNLLVSQKISGVSGTIRLNDFEVGYRAWKQHFIFGAGIGNLESLQSFMGYERSFNTGYSNSPMQILAQGGLYIGLIYFYSFFQSLLLAIKNKNYYQFSFYVVLIVLFTFTVFPYQYLLFLLLIIGIGKKYVSD